MNDQKNMLLAIVLSALVLIGWQILFGYPQMERQKQAQQPPVPGAPPVPGTPPVAGAPPVPGQTTPPAAPAQPVTREAALAASPRVRIDTPRLAGSIALKGGRIDDLALLQYRETVQPGSPPIVLFSPAGAPHPFYSEFGWVTPQGTNAI